MDGTFGESRRSLVTGGNGSCSRGRRLDQPRGLVIDGGFCAHNNGPLALPRDTRSAVLANNSRSVLLVLVDVNG